MRKIWLIIFFLFYLAGAVIASDNDYQTLRTFMSAQMYGEAYNELMQRELAGLQLDSKLKSLKIDLLDRTNEKLQKQAKVNPDDAALFTVLADIAFQKGDYDRASMYISTAIANDAKPIAHYVFAKILFRKGNISQAFDEMSKVLEAMPESVIVFNDFQFLYGCKQYGVTTARKIYKDCTFLDRATPIAYDDEEMEVPESPYVNDPTETAESPDFSDYNKVSKNRTKEYPEPDESDNETGVEDDLDELSKIDISLKTEDKNTPSSGKESDLSDESDNEVMGSDDFDINIDDAKTEETPKVKPANPKTTEISESKVKENVTENEEDPEMLKLKQAEELLASAKNKFKEGNFETAETNLKNLNAIYPNFPGKQELEDKIKIEKTVKSHYKEAKELFENKEYDRALNYFKEAYNHSPTTYPDCPAYIGDCYFLKEDYDYDQALKYYKLVLKEPNFDEEYRRDVRWNMMEIYLEKENYEEGYEIYLYFENNEKDYLKSHGGYSLYYKFWWNLYKPWIIACFAIALTIIFIVFILQFMPDLAKIGGDPLTNSQKALEVANFQKAIKYAEKALQKKQPIQLDRQLREVLIQAYYAVNDFEKCQSHAKIVLKSFPENSIAWGYLAKASIEIQDSSHEAVRIYEELYRSDPSKKELLPMLAKHYATNKDQSPAAMEILYDYYNINPEDTDIIIALAEGYVKNRTMNEEIISILNNAIKLKDKIEYRELLARTFSKCCMYEEAARECINVLNRNINNIGIHVVYASSMKKLKQVPKAIAQYKEFIQSHPTNNQLVEILEGLKKDEMDSSTPVDEVPSIMDSLGMPGMDEEPTASVPEDNTPRPDFLGGSESGKTSPKSNDQVLPDELPTMDPFADNDSLFDGFDTDELPEELGGVARNPTSPSSQLDSIVSDFNEELSNDNSHFTKAETTASSVSNSSETISSELQEKILNAKNLVVYKKWDQVIDLLSPEFASDRNKEVGMLLVDAWLGSNKPDMALEIIQALDFDPEMMSEEVKDVMYRTAVALEMNKNYPAALKLYDTICNADINYKDAFDKSDKLYVKMKG